MFAWVLNKPLLLTTFICEFIKYTVKHYIIKPFNLLMNVFNKRAT